MPDNRATSIEGTITLVDGSTSKFSISADYGWQQYGATTERVGRSVPIVEAITKGLMDDGLMTSEDQIAEDILGADVNGALEGEVPEVGATLLVDLGDGVDGGEVQGELVEINDQGIRLRDHDLLNWERIIHVNDIGTGR